MLDTSDHVRQALASVMNEMSPELGREHTINHLLPLLLTLLRDNNPEVIDDRGKYPELFPERGGRVLRPTARAGTDWWEVSFSEERWNVPPFCPSGAARNGVTVAKRSPVGGMEGYATWTGLCRPEI